VVAEVNSHSTNPTILGLKNLPRCTWTVTVLDGRTRQVNVGQSTRLVAGATIGFGEIQGEIR
jgi:hypothetical protein